MYYLIFQKGCGECELHTSGLFKKAKPGAMPGNTKKWLSFLEK